MKLSWCLSFLMITIFSSCYQNVEGCLDTFATNFDVGADNECNDCCVFPAVRLEIEAKNDTASYTISDTIINNLGHEFKILEAKFYLSGFTIHDGGKIYNNSRKINDSITNKLILDNVMFLRVQDKSVSVPGFKYFGKPDTIKFVIGLNDSMRSGKFLQVEASHPLSTRNVIQDTTSGRTALGTIKWANITNGITDTVSTLFVDAPFFYPQVITNIPSNRLGTDVIIKMIADYAILFRDIKPELNAKSAEAIFRKNISEFLYVK